MTVNTRTYNGLRHLRYTLNEIDGNLPQQAIVHANIGHARIAKQPDFDFGTDFLEITEYNGQRLLEEHFYRNEQIQKFAKKIKENSDKIQLFVINGAKSQLKFTREVNEILIDFQIQCGFRYIKAFIKYATNAREDYEYFRSLIPKKCKFVVQIDENISHNIFRQIYLDCYEKNHDELICFFGRKPSKTQRHSRFNFNFIHRRRTDDIIRFSSSIAKKNEGVVSSLVYYYYGFDVCSILARKWNPHMPEDPELEVLDGIVFEPLTKHTKQVCPLTNRNLFESSKYFKEKYNRESLPIAIHTVYTLNHTLKDLRKTFSANDLKEILADRIV